MPDVDLSLILGDGEYLRRVGANLDGDNVRVDLAGKVAKAGDTMAGPLVVGHFWSTPEPGNHLNPNGAISSTLMDVGGPVANVNLNRHGVGTADAGGVFAYFMKYLTVVGSVTINPAASGVVYNTSSDKRIKTLTRPVDPDEAVAKLAAVEPVNFIFTDAPEAGEQIGFFAQDLQPVAPEVVTPGVGEPGDENFVPWMVDVAGLVPTLIAAVQALTARITALEEAAP